jgi:hypothetical protein
MSIKIKKKMVNKLKTLALIIIPLLLFVVGGVYVAKRTILEDWVWAAILFLIGYQWVYLFTLKKNMYTLYVGAPLYADSDKYKSLRIFHFLIGLIICISSSFI